MELLGLLLIVFAQLPFAFTASAPLDTDYGRIFLAPLFQVREALVKSQADSSETVRVRDGVDDAWRDLVTFPYGENGNLVEFCNDGGKTCWMTSSVALRRQLPWLGAGAVACSLFPRLVRRAIDVLQHGDRLRDGRQRRELLVQHFCRGLA